MKGYRLDHISRPGVEDAFSGIGASISSGRWNPKGVRIVYVAESTALACLETVVHFAVPTTAQERWLFTVEVPEKYIETMEKPPAGWDKHPPASVSMDYGAAWVKEGRSSALLVPSVIIQNEHNMLINPDHPDFTLDWVQGKGVRFPYDTRLLRGGGQ